MKRFIIADTHFGDKSIITMEPARQQFISSNEMDDFIISKWNHSVSEEDTVYVIGDFILSSDREYIFSILERLNGKIILVKGNHDQPSLNILKLKPEKVEIVEYPIILDEFWMLSHYPMYISEAMPYANIFGHVHGNPMYNTVSSRSFCACVERTNFEPVDFEEIKKRVLDVERRHYERD